MWVKHNNHILVTNLELAWINQLCVEVRFLYFIVTIAELIITAYRKMFFSVLSRPFDELFTVFFHGIFARFSPSTWFKYIVFKMMSIYSRNTYLHYHFFLKKTLFILFKILKLIKSKNWQIRFRQIFDSDNLNR